MKSLILSLLCCVSLCVVAQKYQMLPKDSLISIQALPDEKLSFTFFAPMATEVVMIEDIKRDTVQLEKNSEGVWEGTMNKVHPAGYNLRFVATIEMEREPKRKFSKETMVTAIKDTDKDFVVMKENVPRGAVSQRYYYSKTLNEMRSLHVWTPAGAELSIEPLPVLYLVHGGGGTDKSWSTVGSAGIILDNLLAEGKIKPMVVVMPYVTIWNKKLLTRLPFFEEELMTTIKSFIESNYNVSTDASQRAIMGLSMGGLQTLEVAVNHYRDFNYICALSSGWWISEEWAQRRSEVDSKADRAIQLKSIAKDFKKTNKLLYFTMGGKWDHAYDNNMETMKLFDAAGIPYQYSESPGGHTYLVWRKNLYNLAPLLFQQ